MPLMYHLAPSGPEQKQLILDITHPHFSSLKSCRIEDILALCDEKDRQALLFLLKEHKLNLLKDRPEAYRLRIPQHLALEGLRRIGATARLYWKGRKVIVDSFTKVKFIYEVEDDLVRGKIALGNREEPLSSCEALFPEWFLITGVLRPFPEDVELSEIALVYPSARSLDDHLRKILDKTAATVIWKRSNARFDVLPVLVLKDQSGCLVELWMDYGDRKTLFHDLPPSKDLTTERRWEKDLLEVGFIAKQVADAGEGKMPTLGFTWVYYCPSDKAISQLLFLLEIGWKMIDWEGREVVAQTGEQIQLKTREDQIQFSGICNFGNFSTSFKEISSAYLKGKAMVPLTSAAVGLLNPLAIKQKWGVLLDEACIAEEVEIPRTHFALIDTPIDKEISFSDEELIALQELRKDPTSLEMTPPGAEFKGILFSYQQQGLNWLSHLQKRGFNALLADEMGLGKTVQLIAFLSLQEFMERGTSLIVAPTTLLFQWKKELARFLPSCDVYLHSGKERKKEKEPLKQCKIILTSYALLRIDAELLQGIALDSVILDEAQAIKNSESAVAKAVFGLTARFKIAMTGTPLENSLSDLWSLFSFLQPALLGKKQEFLERTGNAQGAQRIRKLIRPFFLRRLKEEVALDLPSKQEQICYVEMSEIQRELYEKFVSNLKGGLLKKVSKQGASSYRMEIFEALLRLRQIACHPWLVYPSQSPELNLYGMLELSGKSHQLFTDLENVLNSGRKVLIYSQFTEMLQLLKKEVQKQKWPYVYLDGQSKDREASVQKFQEDPEIKLFLISLKAGGVGLNLNQADYVFLYDPWWNDAVESQAIDRAHRLGRQTTLNAIKYVTVGTIEEKMMELKQRKTALANEIIGDSQEGFENLGLDELCELLT